MNVLSLFDGLSGGRIALERVGIKVDKYYASEIDKYAQIVSHANYPDIIRLGDVTKWREWDIDFSKIDLLLAGFPCQAWSIAGKQNGYNDPRGALVHTLIEIWNEIKSKNPKMYFLFENVKMKDEFIQYINNLFGVSPVLINSARVSAQNRERLYWTNIPGDGDIDLFGNVAIRQPEDKKIYLKDIIEDGEVDRKKSLTVTTRIEGATKDRYLNKSMHQMVKCGAIRGRDEDNPKSRVSGLHTKQMLEVRNDEKTNCLTSVQKDNVLCKQIGHVQLSKFESTNRVYDINYKSPTLTTMQGGHQYPKISEDYVTWRKLTPLECERLQTLPENFTSKGLEIISQTFYNGNECNVIKKELKCNHVSLKDVINRSQVGKVSCAINTILDGLGMEKQNLKENLLIKVSNVKKKDVQIKVKLLSDIVSSIIKNGNENQNCMEKKNVRFAIQKSAMGHVECVISTITNLEEMEILYTLKSENMNHTETKIESIINLSMVNGFINLLQKKYLEEKSEMVKLYIILTLINLIIVKAIFMSAKITDITYLYIDSLKKLQQTCLEMDLLSLEMGSIIDVSSPRRYHMLGNGWTIDVICHILKGLK